MIKIVFWNLSGGSGKSTLALGLAKELMRRSRTVVIVDLDTYIGNTFSGIPISHEPDEKYEFNLFDCPPTKREDILAEVKAADIVIVPQHSSCTLDVDQMLEDWCDPKKTFLVPTWYQYGRKVFTTKKFNMTENKLTWSVPAMDKEVSKVCEELADSIMGKPA